MPVPGCAGARRGLKTLEFESVRLGVPGRTLFDDLFFTISPGDSVSVLGSSGSGKTSFLNCAAGIRRPEKGTVQFSGSNLFSMTAAARSRLRLTSMGMVFQFSELLPELTVTENVALPLRSPVRASPRQTSPQWTV